MSNETITLDAVEARSLLDAWDDLGPVEQGRCGSEWADMFAFLIERALGRGSESLDLIIDRSEFST